MVLLFLGFSLLGFVLAVRLWVRTRGDRLRNRLLAAFTLLFALELLNNSLRWSGWIRLPGLVHFNLVHFPFWLAYGPLVYLYVRRAMTGKGLKGADLAFALPPLAMVGLLWEFYALDGPSKIGVVEQGLVGDYILFPSYGIWIVIPIMLFYAGLTWYRFGPSRYGEWRKNRWVSWFTGSYLGFVLGFAGYIIAVRNGWMDPAFDYLVDLGLVGFITILAAFGYYQPEIFDGRGPRMVPFVKYRKNGLSPPLAKDLAAKLERLMEQETLYLHNDLRLDDLAERLGISRNQVSQVINEHFNRSFFDYINQYRVRAAQELLMETEAGETPIAQIAFDAGFNTRASFYKAFRKFSSQPPSAFMRGNANRAG